MEIAPTDSDSPTKVNKKHKVNSKNSKFPKRKKDTAEVKRRSARIANKDNSKRKAASQVGSEPEEATAELETGEALRTETATDPENTLASESRQETPTRSGVHSLEYFRN